MTILARTAIVIALALPVAARANDESGFIVSDKGAVALRSSDYSIAIGDRYSAQFIKGRFPPFEVMYTHECLNACFVVRDGAATLEIHGDDETGKITAITAWSGDSRDTLGNKVGIPLRQAVGSDRAKCGYEETLLCNSEVPGVRYVPEGDDCEWGVLWNDVKDGDVLDIPDCALLGGVHVSPSHSARRPSSGSVRQTPRGQPTRPQR